MKRVRGYEVDRIPLKGAWLRYLPEEEWWLAGSRRGLEDKRTLLVDPRQSGAPMGSYFWYMVSVFDDHPPEDLGIAQGGVAGSQFLGSQVSRSLMHVGISLSGYGCGRCGDIPPTHPRTGR